MHKIKRTSKVIKSSRMDDLAEVSKTKSRLVADVQMALDVLSDGKIDEGERQLLIAVTLERLLTATVKIPAAHIKKESDLLKVISEFLEYVDTHLAFDEIVGAIFRAAKSASWATLVFSTIDFIMEFIFIKYISKHQPKNNDHEKQPWEYSL